MTNIYVGNLPYDVQEDEVVAYFEQWGPVDRVTLVFDRETGRPRGFGFVEMEDQTQAAQAIAEAHGKAFRGRPLTVNQARPRGSGRSQTGGPPHAPHRPNFSSPPTATPPSDGDTAPAPINAPDASNNAGEPRSAGYSNQIYR